MFCHLLLRQLNAAVERGCLGVTGEGDYRHWTPEALMHYRAEPRKPEMRGANKPFSALSLYRAFGKAGFDAAAGLGPVR